MSYLGILLNGYNQVDDNGSELPQRSILNFTGSVVISDNPSTGATDIEIVTGGTSAITDLTTDVIATGPGVASATVQAIRGRTVASTLPSDGALLVYDSPTSTWNPRAASGDVTLDAAGSFTVVGIQTYPVSTAAPVSGDVMAWNSTGYWEPSSAAGGGISQLTGDITAGPGTGSQVAAIAAGVIVNNDVNASAAIAGSKIAPDFGAQVVTTSGKIRGGYFTVDTGTIATSGFARLAYGTQSIVRGLDTVATEKDILSLSAATTIQLGHQTSWDLVLRGGGVEVWGTNGTTVYAGGGGSTVTAFTSASVANAVPVIGNGSAWGSVNGTATQAMADSDQTLAASKYKLTRLITTGAITATRTVIYPVATDDEGYMKVVTNSCTSGGPDAIVVASGANPATVTIALGKTAMVWIDANGVTRLTADL